MSHTSNIMGSQEIQITNEDDSKNELCELNLKQPIVSIKESVKELKSLLPGLNLLKTYEQRFLNRNIQNEAFHSILSHNLNELTEVTECAKELCKKWIKKHGSIKDSVNNRILYEHFLRLNFDIRNNIMYFEKLADQKIPVKTTEKFLGKNVNLKIRIENNKKLLEKLKLLEIDRILGEENSDDNLIDSLKMRELRFAYQEEKNSSIQSFNVSFEKRFYLASFSAFEDFILACICCPHQYLKILKIDLKDKKHHEINRYTNIEEGDNIKHIYFGYGSKHTIVRCGSKGKLIILKSLVKPPCDGIKKAKNSFEMLVVDKELKKLACIQVDQNTSIKNSFQPAFVDFVVHNDLIYALDMKCRCIKIFNDSLVLLRMISIPESLIQINRIHLAVSNKFIIIGIEWVIYYIKNSEQNDGFKKLELTNCLFNIAFYDEEHVIIRFIHGFYSFKLKENFSEIKYTHLPFLDQQNYLHLTNFMIKDNFVYFFCAGKYQIYKLNFNLDLPYKPSQ